MQPGVISGGISLHCEPVDAAQRRFNPASHQPELLGAVWAHAAVRLGLKSWAMPMQAGDAQTCSFFVLLGGPHWPHTISWAEKVKPLFL